jgi:hypothetical protein
MKKTHKLFTLTLLLVTLMKIGFSWQIAIAHQPQETTRKTRSIPTAVETETDPRITNRTYAGKLRSPVSGRY